MTILAFEWIKLRSTRAIPLMLAVGFVVSIGLAVVSGLSTRAAIDQHSPLLRPDFDPLTAGFGPLLYGHLAYVAFAVLVVSSEYTSGTIRSSLAAVPRRDRFYTGKIAMVGLVALLVALVTAVLSFTTTEAALGPHGVDVLAAGSLRAVGGAITYVTLICVFSAAVAAMLRGSALSLGVLIPFFFIVSPLLNAIPVTRAAAHYLPDQAGMRMMTVDLAEAGRGLLVVLGWTVVAVLSGYWLTRIRDV
jgi:ABC-2 type transport system permease protein